MRTTAAPAEQTLKEEKTNAMRLLDGKKIPYTVYNYCESGAVSGTDAADALSLPYEKVFKTLVTTGKSGTHYVFDIPADRELDLKKAAKAAGEKNIEMIRERELLPLTGYVHGGCSPLGMKKFFTTTIDSSAKEHETIMFSGGKIGKQIETSLSELAKVIVFSIEDISK